MREQIYFLWLAEKFDYGTDMYARLFSKFDEIEDIYRAEKADFTERGFKVNEITPLLSKSLDRAERVDEYCHKENIGIMCYFDPNYPSYLYDIPNPPAVLFYKGYIPNLDDNVAVGMVGTRDMSDQGRAIAHRFAFDAAVSGAIVVSGMARGIDSMCHIGALDGGGETLAVLGCGVDVVYPPENGALYNKIREHGAVISECFPKTPPCGDNFPVRNRLITGLSRCLVVVEAPVGSGALISAEHAAFQGKQVYTVPGSPMNPLCAGSNMLLRANATPALEAYDFLCEYELTFPHRIFTQNITKREYYISGSDETVEIDPNIRSVNVKKTARSPDALEGIERTLYELVLKEGIVDVEKAVIIGIPYDKAARSLMHLELEDYITALPGGLYCAKHGQEN